MSSKVKRELLEICINICIYSAILGEAEAKGWQKDVIRGEAGASSEGRQ